MKRIVIAVTASVLLAGCSQAQSAPATDAPPPRGEQIVAVVDLSGSMDAQTHRSQQELLSGLADSLSFGDRLVILIAHSAGQSDPARRFEIAMPSMDGPLTSTKRNALQGARAVAKQRVRVAFRSGAQPATDLFATMHTAGAFVQGARDSHRTTLVILSDMLHCARGICMEQGAVPTTAWLASQRSAGILPDLAGACVSVVGAEIDDAADVRVRDFWAAYFQETRASFSPSRYRYLVTNPALLHC